MRQFISGMALLVHDYDEAIAWYRQVLGFDLIEDTRLGPDKRWVLIAPPGATETRLLLAKAASPAQTARVGDQAGGRVFLFLRTDDFSRDYAAMLEAGIRFTREPKPAPYGIVAVFEDLYGNLWDLVQFTDGR